MLQSEFEERVGMRVSPAEYLHIEHVYMASDVDKDTFCHLWVVMNKQRVADAKAKAKELTEQKKLRDRLWKIIEKYGNRDFLWKERHTTYGVLCKKEKETIEQAGLELESGICPKLMSTMLWEIRKHLKAA